MNEEIQFINYVDYNDQNEMFVRKPVEVKPHPFKENFLVFFVATLIHAILYAVSVYQNPAGFAYGVYIACAIGYVVFCFKKLGLHIKKGSIFYMVAMAILGIATFCTDNDNIIIMNRGGIFILTFVFVLDNMCDTTGWKFGKYISAAMQVGIMALGEIAAPLENAYDYFFNRKEKLNYKYIYTLIGCVISIPVVAFAMILLSSADIVFKQWTVNIFGKISISGLIGMFVLFAIMFMASYCVLSYLVKNEINCKRENATKIEALIAIPVALILTLVYVIFSGIQVAYLFVGEFELPAGYTYAEYAREGFFQLLAVAVFNLIIVLVCMEFVNKSNILKVILTVMSCCTFVMIASSAVRMITYIRFYYLTFLRIFVLWSLLVLFVVFIGVIIHIYKDSFPIFKYIMVVVTSLYICLAFSQIDYFIAKVNLSYTDGNESEFFLGECFDDYSFLDDISTDAAPAVAEWMESKGYIYDSEHVYIYDAYLMDFTPEEYGKNYMSMIAKETEDMGIRKFNVSKYRAKLLLGE